MRKATLWLCAVLLFGCVVELPADVFKDAESGNTKAVIAYLNKGGNPNAVDKTKRTLLSAVATSGHYQLVKLLLAKGAHPQAKSSSGWTALHSIMLSCSSDDSAAAVKELLQTITLLLQKGADPNARKRDMETPLHLAAFVKRVDVLSVLVAHGAKVNVADCGGRTPLMQACTGSGRIPNSWKVDCIKFLIAKGADVNAKNNIGSTALWSAAATFGGDETVAILLDKGADPNVRPCAGGRPLDSAVEIATKSGNERAAEMLRHAGAR